MRKTILYLVIAGIFGFGVWYFLFNDKDLYTTDEAGFTIKNLTKIHRIYLVDKKGASVDLTRAANNTWVLNGQYKASPRMMATLLETLGGQEAKYPAPKNVHDNIIMSMAGRAIKAEIYDKDGDPIRVFYVGGQAPENAGTYMLMEGAKRPYVVQLPVFQGYLTPRYSTIAKDWRDRTVVALDSANIKSVNITYHQPNEELNTFSLQRAADNSFTIDTHPDLMKGKELNRTRTNSFATFFSQLGCEGFVNGVTDLSTIIANTEKRLTVDIATKDDKEQHIDVYWMPITKRSKNLLRSHEDVPDDYDPDRYYAVTNNYKDTLIIQDKTFNKIFRRGFEFYESDSK